MKKIVEKEMILFLREIYYAGYQAGRDHQIRLLESFGTGGICVGMDRYFDENEENINARLQAIEELDEKALKTMRRRR